MILLDATSGQQVTNWVCPKLNREEQQTWSLSQ
jgi:hypothetical protein